MTERKPWKRWHLRNKAGSASISILANLEPVEELDQEDPTADGRQGRKEPERQKVGLGRKEPERQKEGSKEPERQKEGSKEPERQKEGSKEGNEEETT